MRRYPFLKPYKRKPDWIDQLAVLGGERLLELLRNFSYKIDDGENLIWIKLIGVKNNETLLLRVEGWSCGKRIDVKRLYEIWIL